MTNNRLYPDEAEVLRCAVGEFLAQHSQKSAWLKKRKEATVKHLQARAEREGRPFKVRGKAA